MLHALTPPPSSFERAAHAPCSKIVRSRQYLDRGQGEERKGRLLSVLSNREARLVEGIWHAVAPSYSE